MLSEILKQKQAETKAYHDRKVAEHIAQYERMVQLKAELEKLSDGILNYWIKFAEPTEENLRNHFLPRVVATIGWHNIFIEGTIEELKVSSLGIFHISGEKHTPESFFKKLAQYIR